MKKILFIIGSLRKESAMTAPNIEYKKDMNKAKCIR